MTSASEEQQLKNQDDNSLPYLVLEVINGQTEHPLRPVLNNRYLIGSASTCQLQIGKESFPPLHSIILIGPESAEIDAVASSPALVINGKTRDSATLHQGDQIQIGHIKLQVHLQESQEEQMDNNQEQPHIVPFPDIHSYSDEQVEENLSDLSVEELVDRIESEEQLVEEYETGIQAGVSALLHEAGITENQISQTADQTDISGEQLKSMRDQLSQIVNQLPGENKLPEKLTQETELQHIIQHLCEVAEELEERSQIINEREKEYSEASEALLDSQNILSQQLDDLLEKAEELNLDQDQGHDRRASA